MSTNPYNPPASDLQTEPAPKGLSHWITVPVGFVVAILGMGVEGFLVSLIFLRNYGLPVENWWPIFLPLDLVLSTAVLVLIFTAVLRVSRPNKFQASLIIAVLLLVFAILPFFDRVIHLPGWYRLATLVRPFFAWFLSQALYAPFIRTR